MKTKLIISILLLSLFTGCPAPSSSGKKSSSSGDTDTSDGVVDNSGGTTGGGGSAGTANCTGTEQDGTGTGQPIFNLNVLASGGVSWVPQDDQTSMYYESNLHLNEASIIFKADTRLRFRFKVLSQPSPPKGEKYCYDRATGQVADAVPYSKLKFTLYLRDILCAQVDPEDSGKCLDYMLGSRYRTTTVGPINVGECSNILDFGALRNSSQWGTVAEIAYVNSDQTCESNGTYCPAEKKVRDASCWNMILQVATDYTQNFK